MTKAKQIVALSGHDRLDQCCGSCCENEEYENRPRSPDPQDDDPADSSEVYGVHVWVDRDEASSPDFYCESCAGRDLDDLGKSASADGEGLPLLTDDEAVADSYISHETVSVSRRIVRAYIREILIDDSRRVADLLGVSR